MRTHEVVPWTASSVSENDKNYSEKQRYYHKDTKKQKLYLKINVFTISF